MARLPIGALDYLTHLNNLKEKMEHGELTPAQKNLAEALLGQWALTRQRRQYIADMVAHGYTDAEIKLAFASPDSPMTVLISAFTETDTVKDLQEEIRLARNEYAVGGEAARLRALLRDRHFMMETVLASIPLAGATHHQSLLSLADAISRGIAELEGLQIPRAGRTHSKKLPDAPENEEPTGDDPAAVDDPEKVVDWGKGFVSDEADD